MADAPETSPCCGQPFRPRKRRGYPARTTPIQFYAEVRAAAELVLARDESLILRAVAAEMNSTEGTLRMRFHRYGLSWKKLKRELIDAANG